jgi:hypothetical protein
MFGTTYPFGRPITREAFRRLDIIMALFLALALLLLCLLSVAPARAAQCNTIFLTDKNGNISFPFCPPNRASSTPGFLDSTAIGQSVPAPGNFSAITQSQGAPATLNATGTLTPAQLATNIITSTTAAAVTATLPLATAMDTANPNAVAGTSFDFFMINTGGTNAITVAASTGWSTVGSLTVALSSSGHFRARKTGAGAWTLYRLS